MEETKELKRSFGGKTQDFKDTYDESGNLLRDWKEERNLEQKHLRGYLKGNTQYKIGYRDDGSPTYKKVLEVWS